MHPERTEAEEEDLARRTARAAAAVAKAAMAAGAAGGTGTGAGGADDRGTNAKAVALFETMSTMPPPPMPIAADGRSIYGGGVSVGGMEDDADIATGGRGAARAAGAAGAAGATGAPGAVVSSVGVGVGLDQGLGIRTAVIQAMTSLNTGLLT
jgi:hypothetical protein